MNRIFFVLLSIAFFMSAEKSEADNSITAALNSKLPTMVDFGAGFCKPCIMMKPILEELGTELKNRAEIVFIDVKENQSLTREFNIMLIPTQIFYDTTGIEIYRHIGFFPKDSILFFLKKAGLEQKKASDVDTLLSD